jgi:hypothetical protein
LQSYFAISKVHLYGKGGGMSTICSAHPELCRPSHPTPPFCFPNHPDIQLNRTKLKVQLDQELSGLVLLHVIINIDSTYKTAAWRMLRL